MSEGFTKTETALLDALERERALLHQRDLVNGIVLHEMANAVAVVASGLELVKQVLPETGSCAFALRRIGGGVRVMSEMIHGLRLLLDGIGEQPTFQRGDLRAFVQGVVTDPVLVAEDAVHRVRVTACDYEAEPLFCATLLRHALGNLVRNALKYSPPESLVTVVVGARGRRRWIHVRNRGPKLDPGISGHLFEPGRKSPRGGMGFGLHITQACALRMGGTVVFGSSLRLTVFSLLLPTESTVGFAPPAPGPRLEPPPAATPGREATRTGLAPVVEFTAPPAPA